MYDEDGCATDEFAIGFRCDDEWDDSAENEPEEMDEDELWRILTEGDKQ